MIQPTKHLDLNTCVVRASALMLKKLKIKRICRYEELKQSLNDFEDHADYAFLPAVHLLYLLGRIEYHPQTDSLEYLNPSK